MSSISCIQLSVMRMNGMAITPSIGPEPPGIALFPFHTRCKSYILLHFNNGSRNEAIPKRFSPLFYSDRCGAGGQIGLDRDIPKIQFTLFIQPGYSRGSDRLGHTLPIRVRVSVVTGIFCSVSVRQKVGLTPVKRGGRLLDL